VPVRNALFVRMPAKMSKEGGKTHMHSTHNLLENMGLLKIKVSKCIIDFLIFIYKG